MDGAGPMVATPRRPVPCLRTSRVRPGPTAWQGRARGWCRHSSDDQQRFQCRTAVRNEPITQYRGYWFRMSSEERYQTCQTAGQRISFRLRNNFADCEAVPVPVPVPRTACAPWSRWQRASTGRSVISGGVPGMTKNGGTIPWHVLTLTESDRHPVLCSSGGGGGSRGRAWLKRVTQWQRHR